MQLHNSPEHVPSKKAIVFAELVQLILRLGRVTDHVALVPKQHNGHWLAVGQADLCIDFALPFQDSFEAMLVGQVIYDEHATSVLIVYLQAFWVPVRRNAKRCGHVLDEGTRLGTLTRTTPWNRSWPIISQSCRLFGLEVERQRGRGNNILGPVDVVGPPRDQYRALELYEGLTTLHTESSSRPRSSVLS